MEEEADRGTAMLEAAILEGGQLIDAGRGEKHGTDPRRSVRCLGREPASPKRHKVSHNTEECPGDEVADNEADAAKDQSPAGRLGANAALIQRDDRRN